MKTMKPVKIANNALFFTFSLLIFILLSCEQPFKAGLGVVVDVRPPTVTLELPGAGDYISGIERLFNGKAEDDYKIEYVEFRVTNHPGVEYLREYERVNLNKSIQNKADWDITIDTTQFPDGDLKIRLNAWDSAGKNTETDEIIFLVRNDLPKIKLTMPRVDENRSGRNPGEINDYPFTKLNYSSYDIPAEMGGGTGGYDIRGALPNASNYQRLVTEGSYIAGVITYDAGIYIGPRTTEEINGVEVERYPPQIRIWVVSDVPDNSDPAGFFQCKLGEWPTEAQAPWRNFSSEELFPMPGGNYQFMYLAPKAGSFYGFEIRAQSQNPREDGIVSFHYPRDFWPNVEVAGQNWDTSAQPNDEMGNFITENRYVLMYIQAQGTAPSASLYEFQDFLTAGKWDGSKYGNLDSVEYEASPPAAPGTPSTEHYYPHINKPGLLNKNGAFTLRIKAYHPQGIRTAEAYWELDGGRLRGRFIWDTAVYDGGWMDPALFDKGASLADTYDYWGFVDPRDIRVKSFTFTYDEDKGLTTVNGRSKIQIYRGSNWEAARKSGGSPGNNSAEWEDVYLNSLKQHTISMGENMQGVYSIEVYVRQNNFNGLQENAQLNSSQIRLDWTPPEVQITSIEGIHSKYLALEAIPATATANGVIQVRALINDDGSNLKTGAGTYYQDGGNQIIERRYIVVGAGSPNPGIPDDEGQIDNYLANTGWPAPPTGNGYATTDTTTITGATIYRHGAIKGSDGFKIKTSGVLSGETAAPAILVDGDYWLYVLARDNAFNIGKAKLLLTVKASTDNPELTLQGIETDDNGNPLVTMPNKNNYGNSFEIWNNVLTPSTVTGYRGLIGSGTSISLTLEDDDAINAGVIIKIAGFLDANNDGNGISKSTEITLTSAEVQEVFTRRDAKIWQGELKQDLLARKLHTGGYSYLFPGGALTATLPDGIYWISIAGGDDGAQKLKLDTDTGTPLSVSAPAKEFWVAAENNNSGAVPGNTGSNPVIDPTSVTTTIGTNNNVQNGAYITTAGGIMSGGTYPVDAADVGDGLVIRGTIIDRNGPMSLKSYRITSGEKTSGGLDYGIGTTLNNIPDSWMIGGTNQVTLGTVKFFKSTAGNDNRLWTGAFAAPIKIHQNVSSNFNIQLVFQDRFGREQAVERSYKIDKEKPKVSLRNKMETFERRDNDRMTGSSPGTAYDKFTRLANGVVSFQITATDNLGVKEVRWWLLPVGTTPPAAETAAWNNYVNVTGNEFGSWNNTSLNTAKGRAGRYTGGATQTIYVNTATTTVGSNTFTMNDNTEYCLYVMAQDEAGNISTMIREAGETSPSRPIEEANGVENTAYPNIGGPLQTIYVVQGEDKPWFQENNLKDKVVGRSEMVANFTINDDDGFFLADKETIRTGSITIEMKSNPGDSWTPATITSSVVKVGQKNIRLNNIDLDSISEFSTILGSDGVKYYRITAEDSEFQKYNTDEVSGLYTTAQPASVRANMSGEYSFTLDSKPPKMKITGPATNTTFGSGNINTFILTGYIWDAYLDRSGADYYIRIGSSTATAFALNTANGATATVVASTAWPGLVSQGVTPEPGDTLVQFSISWGTALRAEIGWDGLESGSYNRTFFVDDQSKKQGSDSLNFIKDTTPPEFEFAATNGFIKAEMELPPTWWTGYSELQKRDWEKTKDGGNGLPVVWYAPDTNFSTNARPSITGQFTDDFSNIDNPTFKITIDGNTVISGSPSPLAGQINQVGRTVNWTVYLTATGTNAGAVLCDGVHSIQLSVADAAGNEITPAEYNKMYGFRINSALPTSKITARPTATDVFGAGSNAKVFDITGSGTSANLSDVLVRIRYNSDATKVFERSVVTDTTGVTGEAWTYPPTGSRPNLNVQDTYAFTLDVTSEDIRKAKYRQPNGTIGAGTDLSGKYEIIVIAEDRSGKLSAEALEVTPLPSTGYNVWSFIMDNAKPQFSITLNTHADNITTGDTLDAAPNGTTRAPNYWLTRLTNITVLSSAPQIKGRVWDTNSLKEVGLELYKWDYAATAWGTPIAWVALPIPETETGSGVNATETEVAWNVPGAFPAGDGYYCVRLRAKDISTIGGGTDWDPATDNGNPAFSPFVYFFIDGQNPSVDDTATKIAYTGNSLLLDEIIAADANGFDHLTVTINKSGSTTALQTQTVPWTPGDNGGSRTWTPSVTLALTPNATFTDGSYEIKYTVWDITGKQGSHSRTITLDNSPPSAVINDPAHKTVSGFNFASETVWGGQPFAITGTTDDTGSAASGVAGVWYRIGYGANTALPANTQAAIATWAADGNVEDEDFDTASQGAAGSLWFKYTNESGYDTPHGMSIPNKPALPAKINLYSWALAATLDVPEDYAVTKTGITMRGVTYTRGHNDEETAYLARPVTMPQAPTPPATDPWADYRGKAIYSLPLVVRVADNAGNVYYELRDIFLFPNGDNPTSKFIVPDADGGKGNARGGQFSVQGIAEDNVSIRNVIYRVKVGQNDDTAGVAPPDANSVAIPNGVAWKTHPEYNRKLPPAVAPFPVDMQDIWNDSGKSVSVTDADYWYVAHLESPSTKAASMPWDFMLNADNELTNLIPTKGFPSSGTTNNMIRVWIEVFAFDGKTLAEGADYNKMSLGSSADADVRRPYTIEFYFKATAPTIDTNRISRPGILTGFDNDNNTNYMDYGTPLPENYVRGGRFAIRTTLKAGVDASIGQIAVRLPGETTENNWVIVYGTDAVTLTGVTTTGSTVERVLRYQFDTALTAAANHKHVRDGAWASSGGTFKIDVRVRDNSNPPAEATTTFEIGVDNFTPLADTKKNTTPAKAAGTNVTFLGRVFDYQGTPNNAQPQFKGVQEVHAWFTRGTGASLRYMNLKYDNTASGGTAASGVTQVNPLISARPKPDYSVTFNDNDVAQITPPAGALPAFTTNLHDGRNVPTGDYVQTIMKGSGGIWQPTNEWDIYWSFDQDTTLFPDGWMTMHYVVIDHAGNASYYTQNVVIMNNYPKITRVTLYTDNIGEGAVFTSDGSYEYDIPDAGSPVKSYYSTRDESLKIGEYNYASGYLNSGFIAKNKVIGFGVETERGNLPLHYEARYVERYRVPLTKANLQSMAKLSAGDAGNTDYLVYIDDSGAAINNTPASNTYRGNNRRLVNDFVNLYTIADGSIVSGGIDAGQWGILGVKSGTPQDGIHFVFQAVFIDDEDDPLYETDDNVERMAGWPNAYVYAYREILTTDEKPPSSGRDIDPDDLKFTDTDFDLSGDGTIPEAKAENTKNAANTTGDQSGTVFFLIKVWDTVNGNPPPAGMPALFEKDMLYDAIVVGMRVYIQDTKRPFARLYDLNPYMETRVNGNNSNDTSRAQTISNAADPIAAGANILRGGLYNAGTESAIVKSGYIEPKATSLALQPYVSIPNDEVNPYKGTAQGDYADGYDDERTPLDVVTGGPANDKVSGTIILRGLAWDDQLIEEIRIKIGGDAQKTILVRDSSTKKMVPKVNSGVAEKAWVYEEIHWQTGHTVEWAYLWNTETEPSRGTRGGPSTGVTVAIEVKDVNGGAGTTTSASVTSDTLSPTPPASLNFHNSVTVDIEPYVTGFRRETPRFATKRSLQGWYSFFREETGIRVLGYNLGSTRANVSVTLNGGANIVNTTYNTSASGQVNNAAYLPNDQHVITIPAAATSGAIVVTVTAPTNTPAWNHNTLALTSKSWNTEYSENTPGSKLWINKPYAHIWRTKEENAVPRTYFGDNSGGTGSSWGMESPSMVVEYGATGGTSGETTGDGGIQGRLHGVWGHRSTFKTFYAANDNGPAIRLQEAQDPQAYTDLAYFPSTNNANNLTAVYVYQWDALPNLLIRTHMKYLVDGSSALGLNPGGTITPFLIRRDNRNIPTDTRRWQNVRTSMAAVNTNTGADANYSPHVGETNTGNNDPETQNGIAGRGNAGRVYTTGYDAVGGNLFFVERVGFDNYGITNEGTRGRQVARLPLFIDGDSNNVAGEWSAVDYVAETTAPYTTHPIIAYYHQTKNTLCLAYGDSDGGNNGTVGNWTIRDDILSGNLKLGSGKYVSMKVDKGNVIHLAFYFSNSEYQTVVYAKSNAAITTLASFNSAAFTAYAVDTVVSGGVWTDISVDNDGNPWIVYGDNGRKGNTDGVRVAYKITGTGAFTRALTDPISGNVITGWEAVTMPADYTIADDRLNIEAWPPTDRRTAAQITATPLTSAANGGSPVAGTGANTVGWHAAIGYAGTGGVTKQFRIGYFFKPASIPSGF
jgi:hypothetical protein